MRDERRVADEREHVVRRSSDAARGRRCRHRRTTCSSTPPTRCVQASPGHAAPRRWHPDAQARPAGARAPRRAPGDRPARRHAHVVRAGSATTCYAATSRRSGAPRFGGHVDLPRMRDGGMGAQFFGLVSLPIARADARARARDRTSRSTPSTRPSPAHPGELRLVRTRRRHRGVPRATARSARSSASRGRTRSRGTSTTSTCSRGAAFATSASCTSRQRSRATRPTAAGARRATGSRRGASTLVRAARQPASSSTSRTSTAARLPRRLRDRDEAAHRQPHGRSRRVRALAQHRRRAAPRGRRQGRRASASSSARVTSAATASSPVVQHLLHILDVVGEDAPALGSDWDGFIVPTRDARRPARPAAPHRRAARGGRERARRSARSCARTSCASSREA